MIIIFIERSGANSKVVLLPHANMKVDPRYIRDFCYGELYKFTFSVNGRTLTIMITHEDEDEHEHEGWCDDFKLRVYNPTNEVIPDFTSTTYTYHGLTGEKAPEDTTKVIFHPSVNIIREFAFYGCQSLEQVTIPDHVTRILNRAFLCCYSLRSIRFSCNLEYEMKFLTVDIYSKVKRLGFHTVPPHPTIVEVERNPRFCVGILFCL